MRLSGWQLPLETVSASSLTLAIQCPEQFRLRYIQRQPEKMFPDRFIGIVDHETHEANFKWKLEMGRDISWPLLADIHAERWETRHQSDPPQWGFEDPNEYRELSLLMVETYHTQVSPDVVPLSVEQRFEERIRGLPVPLVGYCDVITKDLVIDRKTAKQKVSKPKSKWNFQGRVYSLVTDMPIQWHVVTKQKEPKVYILDTEKPNPDLTVRMLSQATTRLNDLYARYGPDQPWPTDGIFHDWLCDYCTWGPKLLGSCHAWN